MYDVINVLELQCIIILLAHLKQNLNNDLRGGLAFRVWKGLDKECSWGIWKQFLEQLL